MHARLLLAALVGAACAWLAACSDGGPTTPEPAPDAVPDFALEDVNPNSATFGALVSPRDYLGQVSAWYFGHAT